MADGDGRLWEVLEPFLVAEGVELDDVELLGRGAGRILRVTVDAEGGIGVDRIADLARGMSRLLDDQAPIDGPYTLEVSSPGLERALRRPSHYAKAVGREVVVKTRDPIEGAQSHRGILSEVAGSSVAVLVDGHDRRIPLAEVTQARTVFRWEKRPKPGKRGGR
ncbi:MAG TPA: ribosome maturation factor RimP [Acidimicrobiia bacterium]|nr:ribosome maturation factor RimP [Acidimicrobiia bacterium]